jgi:hypothetical protein
VANGRQTERIDPEHEDVSLELELELDDTRRRLFFGLYTGDVRFRLGFEPNGSKGGDISFLAVEFVFIPRCL